MMMMMMMMMKSEFIYLLYGRTHGTTQLKKSVK